MASGLRIASQDAAQISYFECFKDELLDYAGPSLGYRDRQIGASDYTHHIYLDVGYPFRENGTCYAWYFFHQQAGTVVIGDVVGLIVRNIGGGQLQVIANGVLDMSREMPGPGVYEHILGAGVAVQEDDMIGFYVAKNPGVGGVLPQWFYSTTQDETIGSYRIDLADPTAAPVPLDIYTIGAGGENAELQPIRLPVQARGETVTGGGVIDYTTIGKLTNANDEPYTRGSGPITPTSQTLGASSTAPEYYVYGETGGSITNVGNLFDLNGTTGPTIPNGAAGFIAIRLANGASARARLLKAILGTEFQPASANSAGEAYALAWSNDSTDTNPDNISDWQTFYEWPADSTLDPSVGNLDPHEHVHIGRELKWIRFQWDNQTGSNASPNSFLLYIATLAVDGTGQYLPDLTDMRPEYFWATHEGSTFVLSQATTPPGGGPTVLNFDQADATDFDGIAATHSIWGRDGTTLTRYTITAVDSGAKTVTISGEHTIAAGVFFDTRTLVMRVDGYDSAARKIRESPNIIVNGGFWREKYFRTHLASDVNGIP